MSYNFPTCEYRTDGDCVGCSNPRLVLLRCLEPDTCYQCIAAGMNLPAQAPDATPKPKGPGAHLKLLLKRLGINADHQGCQCRNHAARMDREGPAWCRSHMNLILKWLKREADRRKIPFSPKLAKRVVLLAVWRAEREAKKLSTK